jgi:hypothetical protein
MDGKREREKGAGRAPSLGGERGGGCPPPRAPICPPPARAPTLSLFRWRILFLFTRHYTQKQRC